MKFDHIHSYEYDKVESPIEQSLLNHIGKYLNPETRIIVQYPLKTISGNFRADIVLKKGTKIVIIECDGEEFHTKEIDDWYDEWRDTLILVERQAETIYRLKGIDIYNNISALIFLIYQYDPDLFNSEYADRLIKQKIEGSWYKKRIYYKFTNDAGLEIPSVIEVARKNISTDFDPFWLKYMLYSLLNPKSDIKTLIELMKSKIYENSTLIELLNSKYPDINISNENQLLTSSIFHRAANVILNQQSNL